VGGRGCDLSPEPPLLLPDLDSCFEVPTPQVRENRLCLGDGFPGISLRWPSFKAPVTPGLAGNAFDRPAIGVTVPRR
jgi:hypothetical protein